MRLSVNGLSVNGKMARARSAEENADTAAFVNGLKKAGGFVTWKEFADAAGVHPTQLSDFQRGAAEPAGGNLLALIQAAAGRAGSDVESFALRAARESFEEKLSLALGHLRELALIVERLDLGQEALLKALGVSRPEGESAGGLPTRNLGRTSR